MFSYGSSVPQRGQQAYGAQGARPQSGARETQVASLLRANPTAAARNPERSIFELGLRLQTGHVLTLRVSLPQGFPATPPQVSIVDKGVQHRCQ